MALSAEELLPRVVAAHLRLPQPTRDSYLCSYPFLLAHVAALAPLDKSAFVVVAHLVYGWMPTILHLDFVALPVALQHVEEARQGAILTVSQLQQVAAAVNHSVVGASKVLHFVNPVLYPIWDRRVYRFCYHTREDKPAPGHFYQVNDAIAYADYAQVCRLLVRMPAFAPVYQTILLQFQLLPAYADHPVEPLRALEFVMFSAGDTPVT